MVRQDPATLRVNTEIINAHMDDEHYVRVIYPQDMVIDTGASGLGPPTRETYQLNDHYVALPKLGSPTVLFKFQVPGQWKNGVVQSTLYYTGDTSSTASMILRMRGKRSKMGTNLPTMGVAADSFFNNPQIVGPATAGDKLSVLWPAALGVTQEWKTLHFFVNRNPADDYTGVVHLLEFVFRYLPLRHEV